MRINKTGQYWQIVLGTIALLLCTEAVACSCVQRQTSQYYAQAETVVLAEVISSNEADLAKEGKNYVPRVFLRVDDVFKGESARTIAVEVHFGSCSLFLQKRERAILFLDKNLRANRCGGSAVLHTDEDLRKRFGLNEEQVRTYQGMLQARIAELQDLMPRKWWQIWR